MLTIFYILTVYQTPVGGWREEMVVSLVSYFLSFSEQVMAVSMA